jgi:outer membrane protein TolC
LNQSTQVQFGFKACPGRLAAARAGLLLACALGVAGAPLHGQVSLKTVVELAQENSSTVKLAEADALKAQGALAQTDDAYIPNFVISSTIGYSHGFPTGQPSVGSATMQSLVFSYSQRQYSKAARAGVQAAALNLKDAREQSALDASSTYIEFDTVTRELAAAKQQETYTADLLRIEQDREEAGVDSNLDLLQTQLKTAELKLARLHLETRSATLAKQIAVLTGLPVGSITPDHASIPEIPKVTGDEIPVSLPGTDSAEALARSKRFQARGDDLAWRRPQIGFGAVYNYDSNELNNYTSYYNNFTPNNVSFGLQITLPFFDFALRAKAKGTAAEALRATVEAEQAKRQNDVEIATLTGSLRELDAQAEVASLKQQIADAQLKTVLVQLESGNGAGAGPGAPPQTTPKAEQLARIDERQKYEDAQEAALALAKARLSLLRAMGHMSDWLNELHGGQSQGNQVQGNPPATN